MSEGAVRPRAVSPKWVAMWLRRCAARREGVRYEGVGACRERCEDVFVEDLDVVDVEGGGLG